LMLVTLFAATLAGLAPTRVLKRGMCSLCI
jgi:hypothetical protein